MDALERADAIATHTKAHWCTDERGRLRRYWRDMRCPMLRQLDPSVIKRPWAYVRS
jgi:hypothetical protein